VSGIDLAQRARETELLDDGVAPDEARRSLADLRLVNRLPGGRGRLLGTVRPFLEGTDRPRLLDVGCGSGDVPAFIARAFDGRLTAVGVDLKPLHLEEAPDGVLRVAGDARRLPFGPRSFDVVTASLFVHHFDPPEVASLLRTLYGLARRALVVSDLQRARAFYLFGRAFFPLMFRSRVSVEDGLLSIRRGFTAAELGAAFAEAGIPVRVRRVFPYRLLAIAERPA
jgi:SAM-dependent methyltransferase